MTFRAIFMIFLSEELFTLEFYDKIKFKDIFLN